MPEIRKLAEMRDLRNNYTSVTVFMVGDVYRSRRCRWGHAGPRCTAAPPRRALCEEGHTMADHRYPVKERRVERDHPFPPGAAKCKNCSGAYLSQANACSEKWRVQQEAKGGGCPTAQATGGFAAGIGHRARGGRGGGGEAG